MEQVRSEVGEMRLEKKEEGLTDLDSRFLKWVLEEMTLDRMRQVQAQIEQEIAWREHSILAEQLELIERG